MTQFYPCVFSSSTKTHNKKVVSMVSPPNQVYGGLRIWAIEEVQYFQYCTSSSSFRFRRRQGAAVGQRRRTKEPRSAGQRNREEERTEKQGKCDGCGAGQVWDATGTRSGEAASGSAGR